MIKITGSMLEQGIVSMFCASREMPGVLRVAEYVREDFEKLFGGKPQLLSRENRNLGMRSETDTIRIYFGCLKTGGIAVACAKQAGVLTDAEEKTLLKKREVYKIAEGPDNQIFILGSDKRGTIYGLFHLSELLGISPFVNWLKVYPERKEEVRLCNFDLVSKEPSVRYRGFFINDEWPAFGTWTMKKFGGINAKAYEQLFELLLRLKGNYMWPAMWTGRFSVDGPGLLSAELADELGIVMGMSHHEPCLRHGEEYKYLRGPESPYGDAWDFIRNREGITAFWRDGLIRSGKFENVIMIGMRGEQDSTILGETATLKNNIDLLRDVIDTQNQLIREYVNPKLSEVPRMLALYKEVEPFFYGDGETEGLMGCPSLDGVTLMLCDDNFGNLRTVPTEEMKKHPGGYGMYYHFDYHGGPISYEWVNSTPLIKVWDQMTNAYESGIQELWIVNVGDLFTMEYPLAYFLDLAYDYDRWGIANRNSAVEYTSLFAKKQFASCKPEWQREVAELLTEYTAIAHMRRPEAMNASVFAAFAYGEREEMLARCEDTMARCEKLWELMRQKSEAVGYVFYELVYYPLMANLNLRCLWLDTTYNHYLASIGASMAMPVAERVKERIDFDRKLVEQLHSIHDGAWDGMGLSEHFGFVNWNEEECRYPTLHTFYPTGKEIMKAVIPETGDSAESGIWTRKVLKLPDFARYDSACAKVYLYSASSSDCRYEAVLSPSNSWLKLEEGEERGVVPAYGMVTLNLKQRSKRGPKEEIRLMIHGKHMDAEIRILPPDADPGYICRLASNYDWMENEEGNHVFAKTDALSEESGFFHLMNFGRTGSAMKAFPVTKEFLSGVKAPALVYVFDAGEEGEYQIDFYLAAGNPPSKKNQFDFGVRINEEEKQIVSALGQTYAVENNNIDWRKSVLDQGRKKTLSVKLQKGENILRYYPVTPGVVLEKLVLYPKNQAPMEAYLGPRPTKLIFNYHESR